MKLFKFSSISFLIFFSLVLSTPVLAEDVPKETPVILATVNIDNAKIISQKDNEFNISFTLSNREGLQSGVKYGVKLVKESPNGQFVVDEKVYEESLTLNPNSKIVREINYIAPTTLDGKYKLFIVSNNTNGLPFGILKISDIFLSSKILGVRIFPETCVIQNSLDNASKRYITEVLNTDGREEVTLTCTAINYSKTDITVTPSYETRILSAFGEKVTTTGGDTKSIIYKGGENKNFTVSLPKVSTPGRYNLNFVLETSGSKTNTVSLDYIVKGTITSIINLSLDKDYYNKSEKALVSFFYITNTPSVITSKIEMVGEKGVPCVDPITKTLEKKLSEKVDLSIPIVKVCTNPKITLTLSDEKGTILDQKEFNVKTTSAKTNNNLIYIVVLAILLVLIVLIYMKKKKTPPSVSINSEPVTPIQKEEQTSNIPMNIILPFIFIFALFGLAQAHRADASFTYSYGGGFATVGVSGPGSSDGTVGNPFTTGSAIIASASVSCVYFCPLPANMVFGAKTSTPSGGVVKSKPSIIELLSMGNIAEAVFQNPALGAGYTQLFSIGAGGATSGEGSAVFTAPFAAGTYKMEFADGISFYTSISYVVATPPVYVAPEPLAVTAYVTNIDKPTEKSSSSLTVPANTNIRVSWKSENATNCHCTYYKDDAHPNEDCGSGIGTEVAGATLTLAQSKTFTVECDDLPIGGTSAGSCVGTIPGTCGPRDQSINCNNLRQSDGAYSCESMGCVWYGGRWAGDQGYCTNQNYMMCSDMQSEDTCNAAGCGGWTPSVAGSCSTISNSSSCNSTSGCTWNNSL